MVRHSPGPVGAGGGGTIARLSNLAVVAQVWTPTKSGPGSATGALDDVQVYDEALSTDDVAYLYSNPGSPLSSVTSPPFDEWATTNITNIDAGADATFDGNPDGDPFGNGLEWILGGDPLGFDSLADLLGFTGDSTTGLTFTFTREDDSEGEAALAVDFSNDLFDTDNHTSTVPAASDTVGGVTYTIEENGSAPDDITATIPAGNAVDGRLFGRLRGTQN
ncbi:hypothetical protein [Haloferula sp. A504]|uniref:hypothetical protein n=1 Tax=Haloferula sp. A504 TaxID=3373601 RepID=UPI0031C2B913|nr:hypothetical protein [Verrucomicrobiaceae bacterium E54]